MSFCLSSEATAESRGLQSVARATDRRLRESNCSTGTARRLGRTNVRRSLSVDITRTYARVYNYNDHRVQRQSHGVYCDIRIYIFALRHRCLCYVTTDSVQFDIPTKRTDYRRIRVRILRISRRRVSEWCLWRR